MADADEGVPREGTVRTVSRTFTREDVEAFAAISRDEGVHHVEPDDEGRLQLHGLLLAVLPTQLGGRLDFLARTMDYEFHRPTYTGEPIACEFTTDRVVERESRYEVESSAVCHNAAGDTVMTAEFEGVVRKDR